MDIQIINHGSIVQLMPITDDGAAFLKALDSEGWQWMGGTLCVDPRYVDGLINHADECGIEVA